MIGTVKLHARTLDMLTVNLDPPAERFQGDDERAPYLRQFVLNLRGNGWVGGARHQSVSLKSTQGKCQHAMGHPSNLSQDCVKARGPAREHSHHHHRPLVAYMVQDLSQRTAVLGVVLGMKIFLWHISPLFVSGTSMFVGNPGVHS